MTKRTGWPKQTGPSLIIVGSFVFRLYLSIYFMALNFSLVGVEALGKFILRNL